jgi:DNA-binding response OmpR family regulator
VKKKSRVLLIEDEETVSQLIVDFLSKHGYEVSAFADAPEGLDHVRQRGWRESQCHWI